MPHLHQLISTLPVSTERAGVPCRSQLADVILSVGDQQVPAHSCVLCIWSEVFKALLTRWSAQRTDNGAKAAVVTVNLSQGDSPEDFLELLHFCYVGTCQVSECSARPSGCQSLHLHDFILMARESRQLSWQACCLTRISMLASCHPHGQ